MGIAYRIDTEQGIVYVVYDGVVADEDFISHTHRLMDDPAWPPHGKLHLTDLTTQRDPAQLTGIVIRRMAELWGTRPADLRGMRIAVVASAAFENGKLFEKTIAQYGATVIVFNVLPTACAWLGIQPKSAEEVLWALRVEMRRASGA